VASGEASERSKATFEPVRWPTRLYYYRELQNLRDPLHFRTSSTGTKKRDMTFEPNHFQTRLRVLLGLQGAVLTDEELFHTAERYPRSRGKGHWDVREYVRRSGVGAREYRVVRGSSIEDGYRSGERVRAAAVGTALNELESQERSGEAPGGSA
jgi:hypothetical protein